MLTQSLPGREVYGSLQDLGKIELKAGERSQGNPSLGVHLDNDIDIAVYAVFASGDRAEYPHMLDMPSAKSVFMPAEHAERFGKTPFDIDVDGSSHVPPLWVKRLPVWPSTSARFHIAPPACGQTHPAAVPPSGAATLQRFRRDFALRGAGSRRVDVRLDSSPAFETARMKG